MQKLYRVHWTLPNVCPSTGPEPSMVLHALCWYYPLDSLYYRVCTTVCRHSKSFKFIEFRKIGMVEKSARSGKILLGLLSLSLCRGADRRPSAFILLFKLKISNRQRSSSHYWTRVNKFYPNFSFEAFLSEFNDKNSNVNIAARLGGGAFMLPLVIFALSLLIAAFNSTTVAVRWLFRRTPSAGQTI